MKKYFFIFVFPFLVFCSTINEPLELDEEVLNLKIRQESLKKIYRLQIWGEWEIRKHNYYLSNGTEFSEGFTTEDFHQSLKSENIDIRILRTGILKLPLRSNDETEDLLLDFLNNHNDSIVRLNSAIALAVLGNKTGLALLKKCAEGNMVLSSSGHEKNDAALGLLLLNEKLPGEYFSWRQADPYYQLIDQMNN